MAPLGDHFRCKNGHFATVVCMGQRNGTSATKLGLRKEATAQENLSCHFVVSHMKFFLMPYIRVLYHTGIPECTVLHLTLDSLDVGKYPCEV